MIMQDRRSLTATATLFALEVLRKKVLGVARCGLGPQHGLGRLADWLAGTAVD